MKPIIPTLLMLAALLSAGCTSASTARSGHAKNNGAYLSRPDYFKTYRTVVGSNIPLAPGRIPSSNVFATTPPTSIDREHPSLYPTEPVVGATPNIEPGTRPVNVGAGAPGSNPMLPIDQ